MKVLYILVLQKEVCVPELEKTSSMKFNVDFFYILLKELIQEIKNILLQKF